MGIRNKGVCAYVVAILVMAGWATVPGSASGRQGSSANSSAAPAQGQNSAQSNAGSSASSASSTTGQDPLAAAARKAKEQKRQSTKPPKVFTNDNLPSTGISTVGASASADDSPGASARPSGAAVSDGQGEKYWRDKFASLNKKLDQDQEELGIMQREMGQLNLQNYSDPNVAMQQGYSRSDIDKKTADIDAKQKDIEADKQAIADAQDDLRKSGGDSGWGR